MAGSVGLSARKTATLEKLGIGLNYNAYGDSISDLHIDPAELAREMRPFEDPQDFVRHSSTFARLASGYDEDMRKARALMPTRQVPGATTLVLPGEPWARRAIGVLANESGNSITLVGPEGKQHVILRTDLEELSSTGKSAMPEGLEKDLKPQDVADVIAFLRSSQGAQK